MRSPVSEKMTMKVPISVSFQKLKLTLPFDAWATGCDVPTGLTLRSNRSCTLCKREPQLRTVVATSPIYSQIIMKAHVILMTSIIFLASICFRRYLCFHWVICVRTFCLLFCISRVVISYKNCIYSSGTLKLIAKATEKRTRKSVSQTAD